MEKTIEVLYAGVVVGRSAVIRELDTKGLFLAVTEPLPVGTPVVLRIGDRAGSPEVPGKVEVVSESPEVAHSGMRVRFADAGAAALFGKSTETADAEPTASEPVPTLSSVARPASAPVPTAASVARPVNAPAASPTTVSPSAPSAVATAVPEPIATMDEGDDDRSAGVSVSTESQRIPAPDPGAFSGPGGGRKNRRARRR